MGNPGESGFVSQEMIVQAVSLSGLDKAKCTCGARDPDCPSTIHYPACPRDEAFRRALKLLRPGNSATLEERKEKIYG